MVERTYFLTLTLFVLQLPHDTVPLHLHLLYQILVNRGRRGTCGGTSTTQLSFNDLTDTNLLLEEPHLGGEAVIVLQQLLNLGAFALEGLIDFDVVLLVLALKFVVLDRLLLFTALNLLIVLSCLFKFLLVGGGPHLDDLSVSLLLAGSALQLEL